MANHVNIPRLQYFGGDAPRLGVITELHRTLPASLLIAAIEALFPTRHPALRLTSRPLPVREVWSRPDHRKAATGSLIAHGVLIAALVIVSFLPTHRPQVVEQHQSITLIAPRLSDYNPVMAPARPKIALAGGGGGGTHAKLFEAKGRLPKVAPIQITPPTVEIVNMKPKLTVEATVVAPPNVRLPDMPNMPNVSNPMASRVTGPASNGTGTGGGIGSGAHGGIGSGSGPGHGPGQGGGFGGGTYRLGDIGVTAPVAKFTPDPDFTEEARKAKHQGTVTLAAIIGPDGRPRNVKVVHSLGMGLDERALEKVRTWLFEPGKKNGQPVAVAMTLEVDFRLF